MAETDMVEKVAKACREAVALDRGRSVSFEEMSHIVAQSAIEAMTAWQPIETVPKGKFVDVWVVDDEDDVPNGSRWTDVKVLGSAPYLLVLPNTSPDGDLGVPFHPEENGVWISHWMERPAPPSKD